MNFSKDINKLNRNEYFENGYVVYLNVMVILISWLIAIVIGFAFGVIKPLMKLNILLMCVYPIFISVYLNYIWHKELLEKFISNMGDIANDEQVYLFYRRKLSNYFGEERIGYEVSTYDKIISEAEKLRRRVW